MVYKGKSQTKNGWFGDIPILGNLHIQKSPKKRDLQNSSDGLFYYPDAPCMEYLPTFTQKMTQM
jgi:hypothetical protein